MRSHHNKERVTTVEGIGPHTFITEHTDVEATRAHDLPGLELTEGRTDSASDGDKKKHNGRFYKFVRKHFLPKGSRANNVKEIHIVPEGAELLWASRSAGSAVSRSSVETSSSDSSRDEALEVIHDMADEYVPES